MFNTKPGLFRPYTASRALSWLRRWTSNWTIYIYFYLDFLTWFSKKNQLTLLLGNLKQRKIILYQGIFSIRRALKTLRDQELFVAAHLFAEEVNTESDLVGKNLATKGDEPYFQDLPIYNKLISLQQRWGKKPPMSYRMWQPHRDASRARGQVGREVAALAWPTIRIG